MAISDDTSAQVDVMDQALLDTLVQVEHEICELDKVPANKQWTRVHAQRYRELQRCRDMRMWQAETENLPCIITVTSKIRVLPTVKGIGC